jgi:flagellar hook protein FlgE
MTISSSLNAGVAGLNANANRLASISDNIANSATYGYKRARTDFMSVVVNTSSNAVYSAGGVQVSNMRLIDARGPLIATANATDLAMDGRGFMPVTSVGALNGVDQSYPITLVTTGSFRPDATGVLRTQNGQVLMGWPAEADGSLGNYARDTMAGLVPVRINANQYISNPTTKMSLGVNLPATQTIAGSSGHPLDMTIEYFGNLGTSEALTFTFTPTVPAIGASNTWTVNIKDSASAGATVAQYTMAFNSSQALGGTLTGVTTVTGAPYNPADGTVALTVAGGTIALNLGEIGKTGGMTQLSESFAPVSISKNGTPVASLTGVEVDESGDMYALYDQGFTRRIYRIPVVDVPNPNGLLSLSNQTYQVSNESGPLYMWDAGDGPTGKIVGFSREESATDVAEELTQLIQTQRAYSSNAKVIQTVDEMLQETTNIKR